MKQRCRWWGLRTWQEATENSKVAIPGITRNHRLTRSLEWWGWMVTTADRDNDAGTWATRVHYTWKAVWIKVRGWIDSFQTSVFFFFFNKMPKPPRYCLYIYVRFPYCLASLFIFFPQEPPNYPKLFLLKDTCKDEDILISVHRFSRITNNILCISFSDSCEVYVSCVVVRREVFCPNSKEWIVS